MTDEEKHILELLGSAFSSFIQLEPYHPDDLIDFKQAINAAQNIVMSRLAVRSDKSYFLAISPDGYKVEQ